MAKDRFGEEIEVNAKTGYSQDKDLLQYEIRAENSNKGDNITVRCCLCRNPLTKSGNGWCYNCETYPINIIPIRWCPQAHKVNPDGVCKECEAFTNTALEPVNAQWIDTGVIPKRLDREKVKALVADIVAKLSGPGWPEKIVPLRRDMIPRSWKRKPLRVVGQTPLGYDIVLPAGIAETSQDESVPF